MCVEYLNQVPIRINVIKVVTSKLLVDTIELHDPANGRPYEELIQFICLDNVLYDGGVSTLLDDAIHHNNRGCKFCWSPVGGHINDGGNQRIVKQNVPGHVAMDQLVGERNRLDQCQEVTQRRRKTLMVRDHFFAPCKAISNGPRMVGRRKMVRLRIA